MSLQPIHHLAIIMDGNGRWAADKNLPRHVGHAAGAEVAMDMVEACLARNVQVLTLYAFSIENMSRDKKEVDFIKDLFASKIIEKKDDLTKNGVCVKVMGSREGIDSRVRKVIEDVEKSTAHNTKLNLNIAFNYSGRWHIEKAIKAITHEKHSNEKAAIESFHHHMATDLATDPDLLIRTGGESRISNFMLWHLAYTELLFLDGHWPDFTVEQLDQALEGFQTRDRRFGLLARKVST